MIYELIKLQRVCHDICRAACMCIGDGCVCMNCQTRTTDKGRSSPFPRNCMWIGRSDKCAYDLVWRDKLEGVDWRIILKGIFKNDFRMWTGVVWLRIGTNCRLTWTQKWTLSVDEGWGLLCCTEMVGGSYTGWTNRTWWFTDRGFD
jgi:hypothetical protein